MALFLWKSHWVSDDRYGDRETHPRNVKIHPNLTVYNWKVHDRQHCFRQPIEFDNFKIFSGGSRESFKFVKVSGVKSCVRFHVMSESFSKGSMQAEVYMHCIGESGTNELCFPIFLWEAALMHFKCISWTDCKVIRPYVSTIRFIL